ncbi:hypothetical protein BTR14_04050 [Rhizobium rhizosphaerae]|uniref:HTH luxR-type domain-containing protein n=1 Tax=Xaviernesmea rhizosphaerae TaxID=1672749 RepID=A0ABX3PHV6_9HYPH|nr:helix-turn-helix transcriptional regulator [Xaviernesmea rhizosphaerae]OQP87742.1 hypothetical protein BTR14_04050 [Xaviernesmea rhizosphaerae]
MLDLTSRIYEAAFLSDVWQPVLHDLAGAVAAEGAVIANISDPAIPYIASPGVAPLYDEFFRGGWLQNNAKTKALLSLPVGGFFCDADHLSDAWMAEQPVYRDFYWPRGFGYAAGTVIESPNGDLVTISIEKKRGERGLDRGELDRLNDLRPHLARAALLACRFALARIEASLEALSLAGLPAASIRADGRVIAANALFPGIVDQATIESQDRLLVRHREVNQALYALLAQARQRSAEGAPPSRSFPIPSRPGSLPAVLHLLPVTGAVRDIFVSAAFFVVITPLKRQAAVSTDILRGLFDLTPAEARIGQSLVEGATIKETADSFGIAVETARSHVKSILAKSGMSRQGDFVAAISALPQMHDDADLQR